MPARAPALTTLLPLLLAGAGLAGCLDGAAANPPSACREPPPSTTPSDAPHHAEESRLEQAPAWRVGQRWTLSVEGPSGESLGEAFFRVVGHGTVGAERTYCVEEEYRGAEWRRAAPPRVVHYSVASLNQVWDACGEFGVMPPCSGRARTLDFPLAEGKRWVTQEGGGDVVILHNVTATWDAEARLPEAAGSGTGGWRIVSERQSSNPHVAFHRLYAPSVGVVVEQETFVDGERTERWVLSEFSRS